jgi:hypothetical protein
MLDHFRASGPKVWWVVTSGLTNVLDDENLTQAQEVLYHLDADALVYLMEALSFDVFSKVNHKGTTHMLWESIKHTYGDASTWDDGKYKEDEAKVMVHEDVEHDHNKVVVEDCSTSWSSEDDDHPTTSSLDKMDVDASSDASDDATSCTLDDDDGYESDDSTTSSPTSSHCSMSLGDNKVKIGNVVMDCDDPSFELVCKLSRALEKEFAKTSKLEKENSFLKNTCEQQEHLLYVTTCSHDVLKLAHEELSVAHDNLLQEHAFLTNKLYNE